MQKLLVIGCGSVGRRHARVFRELGVSHIVGVDPRPDRLQQARDEVGLDEFYGDIESALAVDHNAAVIATPPYLHTNLALRCAEAGLHLFIEKPLATTDAGLDRLAEICSAKGLVAYTAYCYRYIPSVARLKALLADNRVGKVFSARLWFSSYLPDWHPWEDYRSFYMARKEQGGGALFDESHGIDMMRWLIGDIVEVNARIGNVSDLEITSDDIATLLLRFDTGAVGSAHFDLLGRSPRIGLEIVGSDGTILWDRIDPKIDIFDAAKKKWSVETFPETDTTEAYELQARAFLDAVDSGKPLRNGLAEGRKTLHVLAAAIASSENQGQARQVRRP